ncbi:MAG: hypothetical protein HOY78_23645 [Saccharothrix sp.]|nr:hypothetical protein [Saccharothrix sp.]
MRKVTIAAVLAASTLAACTAAPDGTGPETGTVVPPVESTTAVIAFHQDGRIRFANAAGRVWGDLAVTKPAWEWARDGKHLAVLDDNRLHVVDTATGQATSQPCPCRGLTKLGDEFATFTADGAALLLFTPQADARRVPLARPLESPDLVAGNGQRVIATETSPDPDAERYGRRVVIAVAADGAVSPLIENDSLAAIAGGSHGAMSPDGAKLAAVDAPGKEMCHIKPALLSLLPDTVNPARPAATPDGPEVARAVLTGPAAVMTGLRWAGDDVLVTLGPKPGCHQTTAARYLTFRFAGDRWEQLAAGALEVGFGSDGRSYAIELAELVDTKGFEDVPSGTLVITDAAGRRTNVGDRVERFELAPAEEAVGKAKPLPRPEVEEFPKVSDTGEPLDEKYLNLAKRIAEAASSGDVTTLKSLCDRCDERTREAITTEQGRRAIALATRAHPAVRKDSATYPGLADKSCLDGPREPDSCTAQQIRDVGLLGLKPKFNGASGYDDIYRADVAGSVRLETDGNNVSWVGGSIDAEPYRVDNGSPFDKTVSYFFAPPQGGYSCGIQADKAGCHGSTRPVPPRPASCGTGPSWGGGMFVGQSGEADFLCTGGVIFWPGSNRGVEPGDRLTAGQRVSALGYTCTAGEQDMRCVHDATGHGFRMAPTSNEKF